MGTELSSEVCYHALKENDFCSLGCHPTPKVGALVEASLIHAENSNWLDSLQVTTAAVHTLLSHVQKTAFNSTPPSLPVLTFFLPFFSWYHANLTG